MRNLKSLPVILSASRRFSWRCPVVESSLGNDDVRERDSCIVASYTDSLVDWASAWESDNLNRCEWDLNAALRQGKSSERGR